MAALESRNTTHNDALRQFIRHPTDIPIELERPEAQSVQPGPRHPPTLPLNNVSLGGVSCISTEFYQSGDVITIRIHFVVPEFVRSAQVVWCRQFTNDLFEVGLTFLRKQDAFAVRMVEQVCHIEQYKRRTYADEGRLLTGEEAAAEWISAHAHEFPPLTSFHS